MSLQPLTWRTGIVQTRDFEWRSIKRRLKRYQQSLVKYLHSQYYVTDALSDVRQAFRLNEDITLGGLMIMGAISFATISIFANVMYYFFIVASLVSASSGLNIADLAVVAFAVLVVLCVWLSAFLQNILMQSLYEGSTRKQHKSLRKTASGSLRNATRTASAWSYLIINAVAPGAALNACLLGTIKLFHPSFNSILPYVIALESVALARIFWVLTNYSLLPQVILFGKRASWSDAAKQAKQLVSRKGRILTLCIYAAGAIELGAMYLIAWGIHSLTLTGTTLVFSLLCIVPISLTNACFTMLYRKRRLARS